MQMPAPEKEEIPTMITGWAWSTGGVAALCKGTWGFWQIRGVNMRQQHALALRNGHSLLGYINKSIAAD